MVDTKQGLIVLCILIVTTLQCCAVGQDITDDDGNRVEAENSSETCIRHYNKLQAHVLNNESILDILTGTFFRTGKAASQLVGITYYFKVSNGSNDNITDDSNCSSNHHSKYIWSESLLCLLGPRSLYWFTLLAINVEKIDASIQLPCLCHDVYDMLLSRLTYMVWKFKI